MKEVKWQRAHCDVPKEGHRVTLVPTSTDMQNISKVVCIAFFEGY